jgi:hypothetical protein
MSDEAPPKKRRFWQLHLSTAILMSLAFASLLAVETEMAGTLNSWTAQFLKPFIAPDADFVWVEGPVYILPSLFFNSLVVVFLALFVESGIRRREGRKQ